LNTPHAKSNFRRELGPNLAAIRGSGQVKTNLPACVSVTVCVDPSGQTEQTHILNLDMRRDLRHQFQV
jgi:hypothetical protein